MNFCHKPSKRLFLSCCLQPYALAGECLHRAETDVFLAFAFFALCFGDQPAQGTVDAPVVLHGRKLCRYEVAFWHIGLLFSPSVARRSRYRYSEASSFSIEGVKIGLVAAAPRPLNLRLLVLYV